MNAIRKTTQINNQELSEGTSISASWHNDYNDTAYIYIGGLESKLTEMDIATVFSQFGNPTHIKLSRDPKTGRSRGFAWLKYEDQRSTVLAVDNFNGVELLGRTVRVDHTYYESRDEQEDAKEVEMLNKARDQKLGGGKEEREEREEKEKKAHSSRDRHVSSRDRSPQRSREDDERKERRSRRAEESSRGSRSSRDEEGGSRRSRDEEGGSRRSRDEEGGSRRSRDDESSRRSHDDERSSRRSRDEDSSRRSRRSRDEDSSRRSRRSRDDSPRRHRKRSHRERSEERSRESDKPEPTKTPSATNQDPDLVDPMAAYFANKK